MTKPTVTPSESAGDSLIENVGTPPEVVDGGGEVSPEVVDALLESEVTLYEADESGFRRVDEPEDPEGEEEGDSEETEEEAAGEESEEESGTDEESAPAEEDDPPQEETEGETEEAVTPPLQFKADGKTFEVEGSLPVLVVHSLHSLGTTKTGKET